MAQPTAARTRSSPGVTPVAPLRVARWRIAALLLLSLALFGVIGWRLFVVQIVRHAELSAKARSEIEQLITLEPERGQITDRLGNVLAMDIERESLIVDTARIEPDSAARLALTLGALIGQNPQDLLVKLLDRETPWKTLARWLEPDVAAQVEALGIPGLYLQYEPRRIYPQGSFAAQIIGTVNHPGVGVSGVEAFYEARLQGETGSLEAEFDPASNPIALGPYVTVPPKPGVDLQLTIDPLVQYVIENELQQAVEKHDADGGTIIVLDPRSGAIRGMASWPTFDPNRYEEYPMEVFGRNPAISDLYEPGSTFKLVTVAAGLQSGAFTADTVVNDTGVIYRYDQMLRNWNAGANGWIDSDRVIYYSSNVGALQLNELTGPQDFYDILDDFGFGRPTGVDLNGEEVGIVNAWGTPAYNDLTFLTNAYGQGISVTPLQMVQAAAAIANDGVMMRPYIVEQICDAEECTQTVPEVAGRPIDQGVAWTIRRMMVNSANHYAPVVWGPRTGNYNDQWMVPGYQVCAKTGTSSIPLAGGGYDQSYTIGSVLGFAPAEGARFVVLVKIDRPKDDVWGVSTAVPVFASIIDQLLRYERIPPDPALFSPGQ
jgi:cell division protein FtsI/penicillin-binding protein 2